MNLHRARSAAGLPSSPAGGFDVGHVRFGDLRGPIVRLPRSSHLHLQVIGRVLSLESLLQVIDFEAEMSWYFKEHAWQG
jgi:hypothetical protein